MKRDIVVNNYQAHMIRVHLIVYSLWPVTMILQKQAVKRVVTKSKEGKNYSSLHKVT